MSAWPRDVVRLEAFRESGGIFYARDASGNIAYPEAGNDAYYKLEDRSYWFRHRNRVILAGVAAFPPPLPCLLDVGGGNGFNALHLQREGYRVAMFEPGPGVRNARRRGVETVFCGLCGAATVRPASAGGICLFDVLEHIPDDAAFLAEMRGLLAPGGMLYLTVPAHMGLWSAEDDRYGHQRRYKLDALCALLGESGYRIRLATGFFALLTPPIWLLRHLPWRLAGHRRSENPAQPLEREFVAPGALDGLLTRLFAPEERRVREGRPQRAGASLFIAAERPPEQDESW